MNSLGKKQVRALAVGLLAVALGIVAVAQIQSLQSVREPISPIALADQADLAQSIYSRNLQAIEVTAAFQELGAKPELVQASAKWASELTQINSSIATWLEDNQAPFLSQRSYPKNFSIPEGQLRQALESFDELALSEAASAIIAEGTFVLDAQVEKDDRLASIVSSMLSADASMKTVVDGILSY